MKNTRQAQKIYGFPDGYPNKVYFYQNPTNNKWGWYIKHQNQMMARGKREYASKSSAKRAFLSMLTHSFQMQN